MLRFSYPSAAVTRGKHILTCSLVQSASSVPKTHVPGLLHGWRWTCTASAPPRGCPHCLAQWPSGEWPGRRTAHGKNGCQGGRPAGRTRVSWSGFGPRTYCALICRYTHIRGKRDASVPLTLTLVLTGTSAMAFSNLSYAALSLPSAKNSIPSS
mgnify:CR=1 FL=1